MFTSKKIEIVFVSKNNEFSLDQNLTSDFSKTHPNIVFDYVRNNNEPLPIIYNCFITQHRNSKDIDYLVFMHADVKLDIEHFCNHLGEVYGKYDVIGLCGCSKISVSESPLNWFCGSKKYPNDRWGCVTHGELDNQCSFWNKNFPEVEDHRV